MRSYIFLLISIVILLLSTLPGIFHGNFAFVFDMGRDLLWTRNMVELKKPTLIGPWSSIAGVYFSPYWYYLLVIPYILFSGDPRGAVAIPLASNIAVIVIGWWYLKKEKHPLAANIFALIFATSPAIINLSSFAFHANLLPLATILFLIGLISRRLPLSALSASLAYSLEPAAAIMLSLFLGFFTIRRLFQHNLSTKSLFLSGLLFTLPFIPQLTFEIRHQFIQTQALAAYFTGRNTSLGGNLPLALRVSERVGKFSSNLSVAIFPVETDWIKWVLMIIFIFVIARTLSDSRRERGNLQPKQIPTAPHRRFGMTFGTDSIYRFVCYSLAFILFHYLAYVFIFPAELKGWYLSGFAPVFIFVFSVFTENLIRKNSPSRRLLIYLGIVLLMFHNLNITQKLSFRSAPPPGPETFAAQKEVVDWIYQNALPFSKPFAVYTYTPPVYDYSIQYILWWRGARKYHVLPSEFSYLPGEITYLPEKQKFISPQWTPVQTQIRYLIIEPDPIAENQKGWLGHFTKYPLISTKNFTSGLTVEIHSEI